jgi:hypothetical protein
MKQTILSLLLFFAVISQSAAQKKSNLKVYAYAYDNSGKYAKMEISNPNYPNTKVLVLKVWFKDVLCFNAVDLAEVAEDVHLELSCPSSDMTNISPPIRYKGKALILYTINGKKMYYVVKVIKTVPLPSRDKDIEQLHIMDKKG